MPKKKASKPAKGISLELEGNRIILTEPDVKACRETYLKVFDSIVKGLKAKSVKVLFDEPSFNRSLLLVFSEEDLAKKYDARIDVGSGEAATPKARKALEDARGFDIAIEVSGILLNFFHNGRIVMRVEPSLVGAFWEHMQKIFPKARVKE
jgi:hypothetical protein